MAFSSNRAAVGVPGDVDTVQRNPVGLVAEFDGTKSYIYLAGVASCALDDVCTYTTAFVAVRIVADAVGPVAVASGAILAANWGWFLIAGHGTANSDAIAAGVGLFIDGTTGRIDDDSVAGDEVNGMIATGAAVANKCPVWLRFPYVTNVAHA